MDNVLKFVGLILLIAVLIVVAILAYIVLVLLLSAVVSIIAVVPVYFLMNWLIPTIFGVGMITFWQTWFVIFAICILSCFFSTGSVAQKASS